MPERHQWETLYSTFHLRCNLRTPVLGVQVGKGLYEAYRWRKDNNVDDHELAITTPPSGIGLTHEMNKKICSYMLQKLEAKGTPTTFHGMEAKRTESMIEYGQVVDICSNDNGKTVNALTDSQFKPCKETPTAPKSPNCQ